MVSEKIIIINESGLHARPAGVLAKTAGKCRSDVKLIANGKVIQAKSILNIMAAAIKKGTEVEIQCTGETEAEDLKALKELIAGGLGE